MSVVRCVQLDVKGFEKTNCCSLALRRRSRLIALLAFDQMPEVSVSLSVLRRLVLLGRHIV